MHPWIDCSVTAHANRWVTALHATAGVNGGRRLPPPPPPGAPPLGLLLPWPPPPPWSLAIVAVGQKAIRASKIAKDVMKLALDTPFHPHEQVVRPAQERFHVASAETDIKKADVAEHPSAPVPQNIVWLGGRYSTTSAYSLTSPPVRPVCPLSSRPTTSNQTRRRRRVHVPCHSTSP